MNNVARFASRSWFASSLPARPTVDALPQAVCPQGDQALHWPPSPATRPGPGMIETGAT
jgi:hypothetical protein